MAVPSMIPFPPKLDMEGNISDNWKKFKRTWNNYEIAAGLAEKDEKLRTATLLTCIGPEAMDVFDGFHFAEEKEKTEIKTVIEKFETFCIGKTNVTYERYNFNMCTQTQDETFDTYVSRLRKLVKTCEYANLTESLITDRIVIGIRENSVRKRLLQEDKLTLDKCIDICRAAESTQAKVKSMSGASGTTEEVQYVKQKQTYRPKTKNPTPNINKCKYCGKFCTKGKCPAFGKKCMKCGKYNHFASECQQIEQKPRSHRQRHVRQFDVDDSSESENDFEIMTLSNGTRSKVFASMLVVNVQKTVKFQLDSGATANLIPKTYVPEELIELKANTLRMYDRSEMKTYGTCKLTLKNPKTYDRYTVEFIVVDDEFAPLLGLAAIQRMKLVKIQYENICHVEKENELHMQEIQNNYSDVFQGEGTFEEELHLEIDDSVTPVKMPVRRVPLGLKEKLKCELQRMEKANIITKVETPTDWVSSLVVVKKPSGKLRICIDPKPLNKALKRSHYPLPIIEDLLPELSEAKVFSKCDVKNAFWHVKLDEESSYLTTFETPFGRYRWNKMPFGISPAPEYFQQFLEKNLEGLDGVKPIADDILIYGKGETFQDAVKDHDRKLEKLLKRCKERNIKLNKDKFELHKTEMPFIGHLLTENGVKPDSAKVEAIMKMQKPSDKKAVQRLLGVVNYLTKFLGNLSDICEPIRTLTHKDAIWNWTHEHDEAFKNIKTAVCNVPVLRYFDSRLNTVLQCDASETGLGATLMQEGQPVAYASRALTSTEQNYAQIEKELLAVVFGFEKFHQFTYGRRVVVESDHNPLETISKKALHKAPKRLQRMLLRLQLYDFEIIYKKGKDMHIADTLSRAYLQNSCESTSLGEVLSVQSEFEKEVETVCLTDFLAVTPSRQEKIRAATQLDPTLAIVIEQIKCGWISKETPPEAKPYFNIRDELSVENNIIFRGERCVIPRCMRRDILDQIHTHIGVEGCLNRARQCVFWPNMTSEIKDFIGKCEACQSFARKQCKEPLLNHDVPDRPWARVGTDIFTLDDNNYLVTVDYFSNFFEIDKLEDMTSRCVIGKLKQHFARHGIPNQLVSDNAQTFKSEKFKQFTLQWDFEHVTSSARYPQSNGKAESAVKRAKSLIKKCKHSHTDPMLALLNLRNTPLQSTGYSPAEQSMNRQTRTLLPTKESLLRPKTLINVKTNLDKSKAKQSFYYDRSAKPLPRLDMGTTVRIKPENSRDKWEKGLIVNSPKRRSYDVMTENGTTINRNRRHLRQSREKFTRADNDPSDQPSGPVQTDPIPDLQTDVEANRSNTTAAEPGTSDHCGFPNEAKQTSSGRTVKVPLRFKDYVK
ncbi:uncharacterized protein K02A2.6-like [Mya arenaria]|uniref:uncharacterized protein K02A2.6-like n=1 Tax=Mya arenaria TaxID=6604 RepID=UPI0022E1C137|nr:uncharacterized protein K02A2.6-like [Mya arenaria]